MAARKPARRPSTDRGLLPRQSSRSTRAWLRLDLFSEYAERRMDIEASQHLLGDGITVAMFGPMEPSREAHMNLLGIYLAGLILFLPGYAQATLVTYDFEDQAATSLPRTGALTSLSITHSGLTVNITREFGKHFDVVANTGGQAKPASWGLRSLDPFFDPTVGLWVATFSAPISSASIDLGDYGDDFDNLIVQAFAGPNATGGVLATSVDSLPAGGTAFGFKTLSLSAAGIQSITFGGNGSSAGAGFTNSVFADNLIVNAVVPEPSALLLVVSALAGLYAAARRRHRR